MIYLASPYSHNDPEIVEQRVEMTTKVINTLLQQGKTVISPVVYGANIVKTCGLPGDWKFWENFCIEVLSLCDELYVLPLDDWETSIGMKGEIDYANNNGKKVTILRNYQELL